MARAGLVLALCLLLGCGTYFPGNERLSVWQGAAGYRAERVDPERDSDELALMLAFSGGGMRAAAFGFGVLEALGSTRVRFDGRVRRLIDEIDAASGVSGGSFVAAYLGLHGSAMLATFPERVLERDLQAALLFRLLWPLNWLKLLSPYWARSDLAADFYDGQIFDGATFGDLLARGTPFVQIHATDLTTGNPFAFTQEQFDYLCSDLASYRVARAVAASSAVPLLLSPITLRNYRGCGFPEPRWVVLAESDPQSVDRRYVNARNLLSYLRPGRRFVRLVDGGISDNLGVRGPFETWFTRGPSPPERTGGGRVRNVALIVVNAQTSPDAEWDRFEALPSLLGVVDAAASAQINRYNLETIELLRRTFELWNERAATWDPPLRYHLIEISFLHVADAEERRALNRLGTRWTLPRPETQRLRRAARAALLGSRNFQSLLEVLGGLVELDGTIAP